MASELRSVGSTSVFAPCVDLDYGVSEIIGDRSFHRNPRPSPRWPRRISWVCATRAWPRLPNISRHGAVVADSHVALPVDRRAFVDMEDDVRPYRMLIENNLPGIMVAHVVFPVIDDLPASLSRRWITDILRGELGFHGCVLPTTFPWRARLHSATSWSVRGSGWRRVRRASDLQRSSCRDGRAR